MRRLLTWRRALALAVLVLGGLAAVLWFAPSDQYLLLPDKARLVEPLVEVPSEPANGDEGEGRGGIFMVDILVRKANLLERLFPGLNDGATLVPAHVFNPVGVSEQERRKSSNLDMTRSQQIAAAVALRSLGYDVQAEPSGALVSVVIPGAPADGVLEPADVIVAAEGRKVSSPGELRDAFAVVAPGARVTVTVRRDGALSTRALVTEAAPDDPQRAVIGVIVEQAAAIRLPVRISIDAGSVGGPSAGLAFALDIVDELGPDVDRGRKIVVTGELSLDGTVEPIGGIKQKTIGAKEAGADLFVVPSGNYEEAKRYAGDLQLVSVGTFSEALADLGVEPVS